MSAFAWVDARRPEECPSCGYPNLNPHHMRWCPFAACRCGGVCRDYSAAQALAMFDRSPAAQADSRVSLGIPPAGVEARGPLAGSTAVHSLPTGTSAAARAGHATSASASPARPTPTSI